MADEKVPRVGADASPIRQLEELSADLDALYCRNLLRAKQDELFRQWREHFAAWEWATRSLAAKVNALPACRAPGTHAPDCECATL